VAAVTFSHVSKEYADGTVAVRDLDLGIADGELMVVVGPSGCGKSTALRMLAGLEHVSDGDITIGGTRVNDLAPSERDVAMVFQTYAIYPHMTVRQNMGFALELAKVDRVEVHRRVEGAARLLDLTDLLDRKPKVLSGGERQRVAMGRSIVREPAVFLMDEPLSNLDTTMREQMRTSIVRLQQQLATTTLYVTHDHVEAMRLGDRIAVMRGGVLQQVARPNDLYDRPANLFVAAFIGSPAMNLVTAKLERDLAGRYHTRFGRHSLALDPACIAAHPAASDYVGRSVVLGLRPEHFEVGARLAVPGDQYLEVAVERCQALGSETNVDFDVDVPPVAVELRAPTVDTEPAIPKGTRFTVRLAGIVRIAIAETFEVAVDTRFAHLFDVETGLPLR
jgi:multiple sugar transport system ATP-binding protein